MRALLTATFVLALSFPAFAGEMPSHEPGHDRDTTPAAAPDDAESAPVAFDVPPPVGARAKCPVMGGEFTVTKATQRSEYGGKHYVFCCPMCKPKFDADPYRYVGH